MCDIPMFTTENGVASLILKDIPYNSCAYIRIQSTSEPENFLQECYNFCKMAGGEKVYVTGIEKRDFLQHYTDIWKMRALGLVVPSSDTVLAPVEKETVEQWRQLHNLRMKDIPMASFMSTRDAEKILQKGSGYFVYQNETCIGIGSVSDDVIESIASLVSGKGNDVLYALCRALSGKSAYLEVASQNARAIALYERLGFEKIELVSSWYQVCL